MEFVRSQKLDFEKDARQVNQIAERVQKESESISQFRRNYELEKQSLDRKKMELDMQARILHNEKAQLEKEKNDIGTMHKTLDSLKHDFVKQIDPAARTTIGFFPMEQRADSKPSLTTRPHSTTARDN